MSLVDINEQYEQIMRSPASKARDPALSRLMDRMKEEYRIPLLQDEEWEARNRAVIAMYRKIAMSRNL